MLGAQTHEFRFSSQVATACIRIRESITRQEDGMNWIWPSSRLLAQFVWCTRDLFRGKNVLELGAGCALPGLLAASVGSNVVLTDQTRAANVLRNIQNNVTLNCLDSQCVVRGLDWGHFTASLLAESPDIILAADCLYNSNGTAFSSECFLLFYAHP